MLCWEVLPGCKWTEHAQNSFRELKSDRLDTSRGSERTGTLPWSLKTQAWTPAPVPVPLNPTECPLLQNEDHHTLEVTGKILEDEIHKLHSREACNSLN